jgi:hypothetical protein
MTTALRISALLLVALLAPAARAALTDNGDGTVTDTVTGLRWDKCSWGQTWDNATPPGTCAGGASTHAWSAALGVAITANGARHRARANWRLPNKNELASLARRDLAAPAIDGTAFPATPSSAYWSSTTLAATPADAWRLDFADGGLAGAAKSGTYAVRLVSGGGVYDNVPPGQPTGLLNDTGQTSCYDASNNVADCATVAADGGATPRQDARFGRDPAHAAGKYTKTGGGAAGFDFSKMCWNGDIEGSGTCTGTLVANTGAAASGTASTDWACTKDNRSNLIWSLQTVSGITWTDATATGSGSPIDTHNTATRCGFADGWRVPTRRELLSIVHHGASSPAIDTAYFPSTASNYYWSSDVYAPNAAGAWLVNFGNGFTNADDKTDTNLVRLVRSGQ